MKCLFEYWKNPSFPESYLCILCSRVSKLFVSSFACEHSSKNISFYGFCTIVNLFPYTGFSCGSFRVIRVSCYWRWRIYMCWLRSLLQKYVYVYCFSKQKITRLPSFVLLTLPLTHMSNRIYYLNHFRTTMSCPNLTYFVHKLVE